ncbi:MAG: S41 family peptidase, partial [Candidatus Latescibacteria bacterium]|nr:S41 family peptidase [Candidatus Latescibacterota bacterium]
PIEGTPADRIGLKPGDLIVEVEGQSTFGMQLEEVVNVLRGDPGSSVEISIAHRLGAAPRPIVIQREIIKIKSVVLAEKLQGGIGYISMRQTRFSERTTAEVEEAINSLSGVRGLVLDLRGNPGGLLRQATQVADLFLPKGAVIVSIKEREGRREEVRRSQRRPIAGEVPLVVLIDEGSASASEIVAGAIQDNDRGVIIGTTSFGKGSVQTIFDLHEVASSALKLTTALYYSPSGRSIHRDQSGGAGAVQYIPLGNRELPPLLVMGLILRSGDVDGALSALQAHFDLSPKSAQQILATRLGDLAGKTKMSREEGQLDTLTDRTYHTQKGREVFGGGGIKPDISIEPTFIPVYIRSLERRRLFFDFAIDYVSTDSTWVEEHLELLMVDDEMVNAFIEFAQSTDEDEVRIKTGLSQIEEIEGFAEDMGWGEKVQESIRQLRASVEQEWNQPLSSKLKPYISNAIHRELVLRFKGRKVQLLEELQDDQQLVKAIEVLENQDQYLEALVDKKSSN